MTARETADRYLRRGGPIDQIYHGSLDGLEQAIQDTVTTSRFLPDCVIYLTAVTGGRKRVIRTYKAGHLVFPEAEEAGE